MTHKSRIQKWIKDYLPYAIIIVVVSSAFLCLNFIYRHQTLIVSGGTISGKIRGWPWVWSVQDPEGLIGYVHKAEMGPETLVGNYLIAFSVLMFFVLLFEFWRKRSRQGQNDRSGVHTTTWVVVTMVAGLIIYLNYREYDSCTLSEHSAHLARGWPFVCFELVDYENAPELSGIRWLWVPLLLNVALAGILIADVGGVCEIVVCLILRTRRAKRRLHLSTATVLMLVAGLLIGANIVDHKRSSGQSIQNDQRDDGDALQLGWPFVVYHTAAHDGNIATDISERALAVDIVCMISILILVASIIEWAECSRPWIRWHTISAVALGCIMELLLWRDNGLNGIATVAATASPIMAICLCYLLSRADANNNPCSGPVCEVSKATGATAK